MSEPSPIVDLTRMVEKSDGLGPVEWAVIVVSGGVGFLGLKAVQHFFPAQASLEEQIRNLIAIIEAGGKAGVEDDEISAFRECRICCGAWRNAVQGRESNQHNNRS